MIPTRSPYSGKSYRLFTDYNDIHVFVEDAGFENLYREIFRRQGLRLRKVFSKNGKDSVIDAARNCRDPRCVYLVDRHWDDSLRVTHRLSNLVVLEKHSIENYLLDYSGFYAVVLADNPKSDMETLFSRGQFDAIVDNVSLGLRPLVECFLAMQVAADPRTGCARKPGAFQLKNRTCAPDAKRIADFIADIGIPIPKNVETYFSGDVLTDRGHGKYMLHFVWAGVRRTAGTGQLSTEKLMVRLAQAVDSNVFKWICDEVLKRGVRGS